MKENLVKLTGMALMVVTMLGCASVKVKHPGIDSVKKVAVVSVTSNYEIRNMKDKRQDESSKEDMASLGLAIGNALKQEFSAGSTEAQVQIVTHGAAQVAAMLSGLDGWKFVPVSEVIANPAYTELFAPESGNKTKDAIFDKLRAVATSSWVVPQGMGVLPFSSVVPGKNGPVRVHFVNGKRVDETKEILDNLGALCGKLGVDAVVVAEIKLSYKSTLLTNISGTIPTRTMRLPAKPVVETNVAIVNAKGELIMNTKPGWKVFVGESAPMMLDRRVDLMDSKGESVKNYNAAIDVSVQALSGNIAKALQ